MSASAGGAEAQPVLSPTSTLTDVALLATVHGGSTAAGPSAPAAAAAPAEDPFPQLAIRRRTGF